MSPKKNNTPSGAITFHTPFPVSLLKSKEYMAGVKGATESRKTPTQPRVRTRSTGKCVRAEKRDEASQPGAKQDWLSPTSLRRLQAKMEAENQQAKEIIQPLLDTENGFVKDLERFLSQRDVTELRRRELLHKRWTERVWFPLQRKVEEHASSCSTVAVKRRQSSYSHYLHHCNTKGFVFLETYDLKEYNPFLLHIRKPHYFKLSTADLKDPLYLQLHGRLKEKRTARSCEAGCKNTRRQVEALPQSDILLHASSNHPVTASRKSIPYHISATATPDGRCHQAGCSLSTCGCRQQPASVQQLQSSPTSK